MEFFSNFKIKDEVEYLGGFCTVVAVKFTVGKVLYSLYSELYARIYDDVDSVDMVKADFGSISNINEII